MLRFFCLAVASLMVLVGCSYEEQPVFRLVSPAESGLEFDNRIIEDEYFNVISYEYIYNGGGVGIGDFNNDGLQDVFFTGNMVSNRLYLNRGALKFEDISRASGIMADDQWCTGVTVVDINLDGKLDLYVCASYNDDPGKRKNLFYINQGLDEDNIPYFKNMADAYHVADTGYSTQSAFLDYDRDGDLDLYVLTNFLETPTPNKYRSRKNDGSAISNDRFYRNNGDGTFTNVTEEAGIRYEGYGLNISVVDFNLDGWSDIYITNDYLTNDLMYINNRNGSFSNHISDHIKHQTHSAMGHDVGDINNDGWIDIFTLDMLPDDNQRLKKMHAGTNFDAYAQNDEYGYEYQFKRNMLQLNNGLDKAGNFYFSEIGFLAGPVASDWSWSALFADFDNSGYRDLFISNGYPKDVTDLDYATSGTMRGRSFSKEEELLLIPTRHLSNYIFRNDGKLGFENMTKAWGLERLSFSNGAAYADLDNDGDLDLIVNNIDEPAFLYENQLQDINSGKSNYLQVKLKSEWPIIGARVLLFDNEQGIQFAEFSTNHGYLSSIDPVMHFGLGERTVIDSLWVIWPDGNLSRTYDIAVNQALELEYSGERSGGFEILKNLLIPEHKIRFEKFDLTYRHKEIPHDDFAHQSTLPFKFSQSGPALAVGDIDGNGLDDLIIGASRGNGPEALLQDDNLFLRRKIDNGNALQGESQGMLLFDAEGDGDLDLYVVNGGVETGTNEEGTQDYLLINDGQGRFTASEGALPSVVNSGSCVKAADFDSDGDLDLFVGTRMMPRSYPAKTRSYLLRNDSEGGEVRFTDVTGEKCPDLLSLGPINDGLWTDFNNDGQVDLIIAGEWMPILFYRNDGDSFSNITNDTGIGDHFGLWTSLAGGDFDNDGDIDYLVGNYGLNSFLQADKEEPMKAWSGDFDNDGRYDFVMSRFFNSADGIRRPYPAHFRNDLNLQLGRMKQRFPSYSAYGDATIDSLFTQEELGKAEHRSVNELRSCLIKNGGNGQFSIHPLPDLSQIAPLYGMIVTDLNDDEYLDVMIVGNTFAPNPFWGRVDALNGLALLGQGEGSFQPVNYPETGFIVPGDAKSLVHLRLQDSSQLLVASQNQDSLLGFVKRDIPGWGRMLPDETYCLMKFKSGSTRKSEQYWGEAYYSQSGAEFPISDRVVSIGYYKQNGKMTREENGL